MIFCGTTLLCMQKPVIPITVMLKNVKIAFFSYNFFSDDLTQTKIILLVTCCLVLEYKKIGQQRTCWATYFYLTLEVMSWIASTKSEHQKFVGLQMQQKLLICFLMKCQQISVTCCQYTSFFKLNISAKYLKLKYLFIYNDKNVPINAGE